jgi:hypothetical protein
MDRGLFALDHLAGIQDGNALLGPKFHAAGGEVGGHRTPAHSLLLHELLLLQVLTVFFKLLLLLKLAHHPRVLVIY